MAALSSCAVMDGGAEFFAIGCVADHGERLDGVDWATAWPVNLRIRQNMFEPMIVTLLENSPTVLRITNGDNSRHIIRSSEFFRSVALESVTIGDKVEKDNCIDAITLPARTTVEVRLMPVQDGRYDFEDSSLLISRVAVASAVGVFVIEPYKSYYIKPLPHTQAAPSTLEQTRGTPDGDAKPAPEDAGPSLFDGEGAKPTSKDSGPGLFDGEGAEPTPEDAGPGLPDGDGAEPAPAEPVERTSAEDENDGVIVFDNPEEFR